MSIEFQGRAFSNILCEREKFVSKSQEITYGSVRVGISRCRIKGEKWRTPNENESLVLEVSYRVNHPAAEAYRTISAIEAPSFVELEIARVFQSRKLPPKIIDGKVTRFIKAWGNESQFINSDGLLIEPCLLSYKTLDFLEREKTTIDCQYLIEKLIHHEDLDQEIKSLKLCQ